jgi:hypothetical protein
VPRERFELAIAGGLLARTGDWVVGQQQGGEHPAVSIETGPTGLDFHPFFALPDARGRQ